MTGPVATACPPLAQAVEPAHRPGGALVVRPIEPALHAAFLGQHRAGSRAVTYRLGPDWTAEDLGWFQGRALAGVATVLYRPVRGSRRRLAQLPDAPLLPAAALEAAPHRWLPPLAGYLGGQGAFAVRIAGGPPIRLPRG